MPTSPSPSPPNIPRIIQIVPEVSGTPGVEDVVVGGAATGVGGVGT
jgi:hypothetical protein